MIFKELESMNTEQVFLLWLVFVNYQKSDEVNKQQEINESS